MSLKLPSRKILFTLMMVTAGIFMVLVHYAPWNTKYVKPAYSHKYNVMRQKPDSSDPKLGLVFRHGKIKLPEKVDLRKDMVLSYDQGPLGSCTGNAGTGDRVYWYIEENGKPIELSRLFLYYMERKIEGTTFKDAGAQIKDICVALKQYGVCEESLWPYRIPKFAETPPKKAIENAVLYKITSYYLIESLDEMRDYLATIQRPVLIGMEVYESFETDEVAFSGIMPMPKPEEKMLGGHAVLVMGYDDTKQILIVRNSWGWKWGDKGHFYMPYEYVNKGYAFDFWVIQISK